MFLKNLRSLVKNMSCCSERIMNFASSIDTLFFIARHSLLFGIINSSSQHIIAGHILQNPNAQQLLHFNSMPLRYELYTEYRFFLFKPVKTSPNGNE